jgi:4-hydroxyproline epimerase
VNIRVIDSHTGGEPTRVVIDGIPDLGTGSLEERAAIFADQFDHIRSAIVNEPRGSEAMVGALLVEPHHPDCQFGVIFFNTAGVLGMCGHGTIGLVVTLAHMGKIAPAEVWIDTPVGPVQAVLHDDHRATIRNVKSYRLAKAVSVDVPDYGVVVGDIAWGGNWFFLIEEHPFELSLNNLESLEVFTWAVRRALVQAGITGSDGHEIDHIELFTSSPTEGVNSRNYVHCPGGAYDRSPCGTGTSAKLACLVADGKLGPGQTWRQESFIGSVFEGSAEIVEGGVIPSITGTAFVTAEATLILDEIDPFRWGIR